jgi:hypothetical protein
LSAPTTEPAAAAPTVRLRSIENFVPGLAKLLVDLVRLAGRVLTRDRLDDVIGNPAPGVSRGGHGRDGQNGRDKKLFHDLSPVGRPFRPGIPHHASDQCVVPPPLNSMAEVSRFSVKKQLRLITRAAQ